MTEQGEHIYDLFISYAEADRAWVEGYLLDALTQAGVSREDAYTRVQRNAMKTWENGADFLESLKADTEVTDAVPIAELEAMFDMAYHTAQVDTIFKRVFGA